VVINYAFHNLLPETFLFCKGVVPEAFLFVCVWKRRQIVHIKIQTYWYTVLYFPRLAKQATLLARQATLLARQATLLARQAKLMARQATLLARLFS
jgi:hypothetical protein